MSDGVCNHAGNASDSDGEPVSTQTVLEVASALRRVAADLRSWGDVPLVELSEDGVTRSWLTLADELWLYALRLDPEGTLPDAETSGEGTESVVHRCPPVGSGVMPCCGRTPFEVSRWDRMTLDPERVTCSREGS